MTGTDLIVQADMIHTLDPERPRAQAVAVQDGWITAVGDRSDARAWRSRDTELVELGPGVVTPGLVDGHVHPVLGLGRTAGVDLSGVSGVAALVAALRGAAAERTGDWVLGWGLNPDAFEGGAMTNAPLVEALGDDVPVLVEVFDAHAALASPAALRAAGITGPREFTATAEIVCDAAGHPTGHLLEPPAVELVRALLPAESTTVRRERLRTLLAQMAATGLTGGNVMDFDGDAELLVSSLAEEIDLPLRLRFAPFCMPGMTTAERDHIVDQQRLAGRRWAVDGVKFMIDGTIDGGTAWLTEPDRLGQSTGPYWPEPQVYAEAVRRFATAGIPIVTHAIGDAAVRYVLDTLADLPGRPPRVPHRIEHIETIPDDLVPRFRQQDVTASMQPTHCTRYCRADHSDNWSSRLGPVRANAAWRIRDLRDAGARVALGSDWPVAPFDARGVLADAQLRRPAGHPEVEPVQPRQGLTAAAALHGYTSQAAASAGLGHLAGRIRPGCRADLSAFGLDPLSAPPDEFAESPVPLTVVAGRITHQG